MPSARPARDIRVDAPVVAAYTLAAVDISTTLGGGLDMLDLLITGRTVIDGSGAGRLAADAGVSGGRAR
ncbi:MAG TPA: hypothetical protein VF653_00600 [Methylomirabilota bacterium]